MRQPSKGVCIMSVEQVSKKDSPVKVASTQGTRFPPYDLSACLEVPRVLYVKGGGKATPDQMAAYLGYKGTNNGAYLTKIGAARLFGLIAKVGHVFEPTPLAHQILSPVYAHDAKKALVDAFMNVELFRKIYEEFRGRELPPEIGMKNALRNIYGVSPNRVSEAYRALMDSAETAGFFETKSGAKTHLILPLVQPTPSVPMTPTNPVGEGSLDGSGGDEGGGGGAGGGGMPPQKPPSPAASIGDVKAKYLSALITLFEEKSAKGELDEKLMERIERLLGEPGGPA